MNDRKYLICKFLDEEKRIMGLSIFDELLPIAGMILMGLLVKELLIGIALSATWFFMMKRLKKNRGSSGVLGALYWFFSRGVGKFLFSQFPDATQRFWRA